MSSINHQNNANRTIDWPAIVRILLAQVLVLLVLASAFVWYLNWSSDVAWKEFISADQPVLSSPNHHPQSQAPIQAVKGNAICPRRA